tara:strand:+ start:166 stop:357 length:192 start_codon:yes stop_codon:yes gene_type:complete
MLKQTKLNFKHEKSHKYLAAEKRQFEEIDFPKLLKECEILEETFKNGYCRVLKTYTSKGWLLQ